MGVQEGAREGFPKKAQGNTRDDYVHYLHGGDDFTGIYTYAKILYFKFVQFVICQLTQ